MGNFMTFSLSEFLAGSTALYLVTKLFEWIKQRKLDKLDPAQSMRDIQRIHEIMEEVVKVTNFERMVVFKAEDSAGVIVPGKIMYITALYEKIYHDEDRPVNSIIHRVKRWRSDAQYYQMMADLLTKGSVTITFDEMPPCNLKDLYETDNIVYSQVHHLMTTEDKSKIFYCSVVSKVTKNPHAEDKVLINSAINELVDIFSRHSKLL